MTAALPLLTFGHGTADQAAVVETLRSAGVVNLVDVRRFPGSRRHPHVAWDELERWPPEAGVDYLWEPRLGGRRSAPRGEQERDVWWEVAAFRAYAAHTRTEEFRVAADLLLEAAADRRTAVMCSEAVWWRGHRRLIADVAVLLHGRPVQHLAHDGRLSPHVAAAGARVTAEGLVHDRPATAPSPELSPQPEPPAPR